MSTRMKKAICFIRYSDIQENTSCSDGPVVPAAGSGILGEVYRLVDVLQAERVFIVEGEKDVETLRSLGLTATTNSGGAGKWRPEFAEHFQGKEVAIFPDNDEPERKHIQRVARALGGNARSVKVVPLPGLEEHGDVSDFVAKVRDRENARRLLVAAIADAPEWKPPTTSARPIGSERCPILPDAAWYGHSREFREIVGPSTEASSNYHLASFYLAVGASLGRSVYVDRAGRQYPNIFTVLVGKSGGARKSTALRFGIDLARALDDTVGWLAASIREGGLFSTWRRSAKDRNRLPTCEQSSVSLNCAH